MVYSEEWLADRLSKAAKPSLPNGSGKAEACQHVASTGRQRGTIPEKRKRKYRNVPTERDGIWFSSKTEAARYGDLKILERVGDIEELKIQVKFSLDINGYHICNYFADFTYYQSKQLVVEDTKSGPTKTPVYRIKKKLMQAIYGITIRET